MSTIVGAGATAPDRTARIATAVWLSIVTFVLLVVLLAWSFLVEILRFSSSERRSVVVLAIFAVSVIVTVWFLFARRKHLTAVLVSVLAPVAFAAVLTAVAAAPEYLKRSRASQASEAEERRLVQATDDAPASTDAWDQLVAFHVNNSHYQKAVDVLDKEIGVIVATRAFLSSCAQLLEWEELSDPMFRFGYFILWDSRLTGERIRLRGADLILDPSRLEVRTFFATPQTADAPKANPGERLPTGYAAELGESALTVRLVVGYSAAELGNRALALSCLRGIGDDPLAPDRQQMLEAFIARIPEVRN